MYTVRRFATLLVVGLALFGMTGVASATPVSAGQERVASSEGVVVNGWRCVVADSMRVFSSRDNHTVIGTLYYGALIYVTAHSGIRYHIDYPMVGWISDNPSWTVPC